MASVASEESAVRSRLLFDGDGTGEERRINVLYKHFIKWCSAPPATAAAASEANKPDEDVKMHAKLTSYLMQAEWSDAKSKLVQEMNNKEAVNYEQLLEKIQSKITEAEADILEAKKELEQARLIRRNRMEYDAMAKQISKYPSR